MGKILKVSRKFVRWELRSFVVIQTDRWTGIVEVLRFVNSLKMAVYITRSIHEYTFPLSLLKRSGQYIYHLLLHKISTFCLHNEYNDYLLLPELIRIFLLSSINPFLLAEKQ